LGCPERLLPAILSSQIPSFVAGRCWAVEAGIDQKNRQYLAEPDET
jgi:hypothetical protein